MSLASSKILGTHSDVDEDFDLELPTVFLSPVKATPEKDVVVDETITIADNGNSMEKSSTNSAEASQPPPK